MDIMMKLGAGDAADLGKMIDRLSPELFNRLEGAVAASRKKRGGGDRGDDKARRDLKADKRAGAMTDTEFNSWMRKQFKAADMAAQERDFRDQIGAGRKANKKDDDDE